MMPGTRLLAAARRWFPPSTVSSVFEPLAADWQRECADAAPTRRRLINARGRLAFLFTAIMMTPRLALAPMSFRTRPLALAAGFWLVTSCLPLPFYFQDTPRPLLWLLLPSSLTLMLPFAILPAIEAFRRDGETPAPSERRAVLALVTAAVIGVAMGHGWITPAANQRWRNDVASELNGRPSVVYRGVREMTTTELIAGDASQTTALSGTPRVRELNMRVVLAALPAVLAWLRWQSLSRGRRRSWPLAKSCLLAFGAAALFTETLAVAATFEQSLSAPGFGPLLALGLFALAVRTCIWWRHRAAPEARTA